MTENSKYFELEERTFKFAQNVRSLVKKIPKNIILLEDCKQLIRSSGSIGANYIEANESLGKKDFLMRIKISRKEAKETRYWLRLLQLDKELEHLRIDLERESFELVKIFNAILTKYRK